MSLPRFPSSHKDFSCVPRCVPGRSAFTLTELMIAIALSLLLILGINAVFKLSSDAVGSGFQLSQMSRELALVNNNVKNDMANMDDYETAPALIIQNMNTPAFRDKTDMASEPNFTPGSIVDPTGNTFPTGMMQITEPAGSTSTVLYPLPTSASPAWGALGISANNLYKVRYEIPDDRNHRTDIFSFFAKDQYRRQTPPALASGVTQFQSDFTSTDAWIWYGHVLQPNNSTNPGVAAAPPPENANWQVPGGTSVPPAFYALGLSAKATSGSSSANNDPSNSGNPNNFYASQWILGRVAILMSDPTNLETFTNPYNSTVKEPQNHFVDSYNYTPADVANSPPTQANAPGLPPLGSQSATQDTSVPTPLGPGSFNASIYHGFCDLAGATTSTFRSTVLTVEQSAGAYTAADGWYLPLIANPYTPASNVGVVPLSPPAADSVYRFWTKPWPSKTLSAI